MSLNNKITKNNLVLSTIIVALLFIILIKVNFWRQLYSLISNNHHTRMIKTFGMCNNDSYGFLKYIEQNYELTENPLIINQKVLPNSLWAIYDSRKKKFQFSKNFFKLSTKTSFNIFSQRR